MQPFLLFIPQILGVSLEVYFIIALLATPFFFLWRRLFRNKMMSKPKMVIASWVAAFCTAPFVYVAIIFIWVSIINYYPSNDFNQSNWLAEKEKRYELSEDIIESRLLIGKSKAEVKQLLGDEENNELSDDWHYDLGFKPSLLGIDPDVLDVYFQNGKVVKVGQHET